MRRYIDADDFVKEYRRVYCEDCERRKGMKNGEVRFLYSIGEAPCRACDVGDMLGSVEEYPSADVVEVVRCKDCKNIDMDWESVRAPGKHYCITMDSFMDCNDYCSYGERKDTDA